MLCITLPETYLVCPCADINRFFFRGVTGSVTAVPEAGSEHEQQPGLLLGVCHAFPCVMFKLFGGTVEVGIGVVV